MIRCTGCGLDYLSCGCPIPDAGRADADIAPTMPPKASAIEPPALDYGNKRAATNLPTAAQRKEFPLATGCLDYFPDALAYVAHVSWASTQQHHPGSEMHWDRLKSTDEANTLARHFTERGLIDTDKLRHTGKVAWRALAMLQKELEESGEAPVRAQRLRASASAGASGPSASPQRTEGREL